MNARRFEILAGPVREPFDAAQIQSSAVTAAPHWSDDPEVDAKVAPDPLLRALLAPLDERAFVTDYLHRRPLHTTRVGASRTHRRILSLDGLLETIASQHAPADSLRFMQGQTDGGPEEFATEQFQRLHRGHTLHDFDRIRDYLANGRGSMIAHAVDHWIPSVRRFMAGLAEVTGCRTGANAYYTPADARAFSPHWDTHDVLVVQLHGAKRWRVWEALLEHPLPQRPHMESAAYEGFIDDLPHRDLVLHEGDSLYLPAGTPHAAWTEAEDSLHLTAALTPVRWHDVLRDAVEQALVECEKELELRIPCPAWHAGPHDATVQSTRREALERLCTHLDAVDLSSSLARLLGDERGELPATTLVPPAVELGTSLRRTRGPMLVTPGEEHVCLDFGGRRLRFPVAATAALRWLLDHVSIRPSDLPQLDDDDRIAVAQRLVEEGLLRHESIAAAAVPLPLHCQPLEK